MNRELINNFFYLSFVLGMKVDRYRRDTPSSSISDVLRQVADGDLTLVPSVAKVAALDLSFDTAGHAGVHGELIECEREFARRILPSLETSAGVLSDA